MFRNRTNRCPVCPSDIPGNEVDAVCRFDFSFIDQLTEERLIRSLRFDIRPNNEPGSVALTVLGLRCDQETEYQIDYSTPKGNRQVRGQIIDAVLDRGSVKKKLFLGTCSNDICTPDNIINNRVFLTVLVNGQEIISRQQFIIN